MRRYYEGFSEFSKGDRLFENEVLEEEVPEEKRAYIDELMKKVTDLLDNLGPVDGWELDEFALSNGWFTFKGEDEVEVHLTPFFDYYDDITPSLNYDGQVYELPQYGINNLSKRLTMDLSRDASMIRGIVVDLLKRSTTPETYIKAMKSITGTRSDAQLIEYALERQLRGIIKTFIVSGTYVPDNLDDVATIIQMLDKKDHEIVIKYIFPAFARGQKTKNLFGV
jgi:hypothetical protein